MTLRVKRLITELTPVFLNIDKPMVQDFIVRRQISQKFIDLGRSYLKMIDDSQDQKQYYTNQSREATRIKKQIMNQAIKEGELLKSDLRMHLDSTPRIINLVESVDQGVRGQSRPRPEVDSNPDNQSRPRTPEEISWERARVSSYIRLVRGLLKLDQAALDLLTELDYDETRLEMLELQFEQALVARASQDDAVASRSISVVVRDDYVSKLERWRTSFQKKVRYGLNEEPENMHTAIRRLLSIPGPNPSTGTGPEDDSGTLDPEPDPDSGAETKPDESTIEATPIHSEGEGATPPVDQDDPNAPVIDNPDPEPEPPLDNGRD